MGLDDPLHAKRAQRDGWPVRMRGPLGNRCSSDLLDAGLTARHVQRPGPARQVSSRMRPSAPAGPLGNPRPGSSRRVVPGLPEDTRLRVSGQGPHRPPGILPGCMASLEVDGRAATRALCVEPVPYGRRCRGLAGLARHVWNKVLLARDGSGDSIGICPAQLINASMASLRNPGRATSRTACVGAACQARQGILRPCRPPFRQGRKKAGLPRRPAVCVKRLAGGR